MLGYFLAAIALISWGLIVIPIKKTRTSGLYGIGIGMPVAFIILLFPSLFVFLQKGITFSSWDILLTALVGIFQFPLGTAFYYNAVRLAGVSVSTPLTRLKPIIIGFIVFMLGIESLSVGLISATIIIVIGVIMLVYAPIDSNILPQQKRKGINSALIACFCWAVGDILTKYVQGGAGAIHPILFTEIALLFGIIGFYSIMFLSKKQNAIFKMPREDKKRYALHGLVSLSIGYLAFFASIGIIGLMKAVIITTSWPLISIIVGFVYFKERLTWLKLLGGILIIISVYIVL